MRTPPAEGNVVPRRWDHGLDPSNLFLKAYNRQHDVIVTLATRELRNTGQPRAEKKNLQSTPPPRENRDLVQQSRQFVSPRDASKHHEPCCHKSTVHSPLSVTARRKSTRPPFVGLGYPTHVASPHSPFELSLGKSRRSALESRSRLAAADQRCACRCSCAQINFSSPENNHGGEERRHIARAPVSDTRPRIRQGDDTPLPLPTPTSR